MERLSDQTGNELVSHRLDMQPLSDHTGRDIEVWDQLLAERPITRLVSPAMEGALAFLAPTRGGDLLDLGCDGGTKSDAFRRLGWRSVGVDINADVVADAAARHPECRFQFGHLESLPFPDASFDATFECSVLQYVNVRNALAEVRRVLRPGGRAAFIVNLRHHPLMKVLRVMRKVIRHRYPPFMTPSHHPDPRELLSLLSPSNGWEGATLRPFALLAPLSLYGLPLAPLHRLDDWSFARSATLRQLGWLGLLTASRAPARTGPAGI